MLDHIHGAKDDVIMDVSLVCMGRQHVFILAAQNIIGKLPPDFMCQLRGSFARLERLYQVMGDIIAFLHGLFERHFKLNIRCFIRASERGHNQLAVRLSRVLDVFFTVLLIGLIFVTAISC